MGTGESMARGICISMKCQKIQILGSHRSFQTLTITAEEANTLKTTHDWNSQTPGEEVEGEMATDTLPVATSYTMYLKLHYWKDFTLK